jgi:hypothetical protein
LNKSLFDVETAVPNLLFYSCIVIMMDAICYEVLIDVLDIIQNDVQQSVFTAFETASTITHPPSVCTNFVFVKRS